MTEALDQRIVNSNVVTKFDKSAGKTGGRRSLTDNWESDSRSALQRRKINGFRSEHDCRP